jgi:RHS repeat-associated protein
LISETLTDQYDLDWIYDLAGNRRTQTKSLPDGNEGYNPSEQTTYVYDSNDRLITETKTVGGGAPETNTYEYNKTQQHIESGTVDGIHTSQTVEYNLQGLLESVSVIKSNSAIRTRTSYEYDSTGTRTSSARFTRDSLGSGLWEIASRTEFLTDSENHTGYSQVLQETTYEGGVATKKVIFTVGHDQISQSTLAREAGTETWSLESDAWFGTDGHGSVRVLYDLAAAIAKDLANAARLQVYTFDAYGNLQGWPTSSLTPNTLPLTTYLYSGESFDFNIGQQYLRARFYDATTGRFNRLDPFFGNSSDPQSFHKYAYVHGDPIQGIDPTGMFLGILVGVAIGIGKSGNELLAGGLTISILKTAGQAGFDARDIGMILIARGDFDRGWMLFNLGSRIAELSFNTIDQIDSIVGTAGLVTALSFGAVAVAKNLPDIANTVADGVTKLGRMSDNLVAAARNLSKKSFNNAKYAGTLQGAMALQQRAEAINSSRRAWDVTNGTTAVIRAKNVDTGDVKVFVSTEAPTRPRQISLTSEEEYVAGIGHAEQTFFDKKGEHWIVIEGGTSRNVCRSTCAPLVEGAGLTLGGPKFAGRGDKTDYRAFWRDGE